LDKYKIAETESYSKKINSKKYNNLYQNLFTQKDLSQRAQRKRRTQREEEGGEGFLSVILS
jgi:hypothetical protein